jgi:hypothetical protein
MCEEWYVYKEHVVLPGVMEQAIIKKIPFSTYHTVGSIYYIL